MGPPRYGSPRVMKWERRVGIIPPAQFLGNPVNEDTGTFPAVRTGINQKPRRLRLHFDCNAR